MAIQTLRQATFLGGVATIDVVYDDITNIISSLQIVVTRGILTITLSGSPLPSPISQSFTGITTFDLTVFGVPILWVANAGTLSWPVTISYQLTGTS